MSLIKTYGWKVILWILISNELVGSVGPEIRKIIKCKNTVIIIIKGKIWSWII